MNDARFTITIVIVLLLLIASGVAMATKWLPVPYTIALLLVGILISPMHFLPPVHISPDLILLIFLPVLIFEASWSLKLARLRANLFPILFLAVVGVGLSVLITGSACYLWNLHRAQSIYPIDTVALAARHVLGWIAGCSFDRLGT